MQMLQDPWYNAAQQFGSGVGNYLQQATDRSIFRDNLSAAQQLMESQGKNMSPTQALFGLLQASGGNPAFLQTISEIYPHLRAEQKRPAGAPFNFFGRGDQGAPPPRQGSPPPRGNMGNVTPREQRNYMTPSGQSQGYDPYNVQMYPDATGDIADASTSRIDSRQPQNVSGDNQTRRAGSETEGVLTPDLYDFTPEMQENLMNQVVRETGDVQQAGAIASQMREGINNSNKIKLDKFNSERTIDNDQRDFLDGKLRSLGFFNEKGQDVDPYLTTQAYQEWNRVASDPKYKNDTQRWNAAQQNIRQYQNVENEMLKGSGSPYWWDNPLKALSGAKRANKAYRDTMGVIDPKTGKADPIKVDRMKDLNKRQGWPDDAAAEIALPTSDEVNRAIDKSPSIYSVDIPAGWEQSAQAYDKYKIQDPKKRDAVLTRAASELYKNINQNDSLPVVRRKLYNKHGYNEDDFRTILDKMEAMGWKMSEFQKREEGSLNMKLERSLSEILDGYSLTDVFKQPRYLK